MVFFGNIVSLKNVMHATPSKLVGHRQVLGLQLERFKNIHNDLATPDSWREELISSAREDLRDFDCYAGVSDGVVRPCRENCKYRALSDRCH